MTLRFSRTLVLLPFIGALAIMSASGCNGLVSTASGNDGGSDDDASSSSGSGSGSGGGGGDDPGPPDAAGGGNGWPPDANVQGPTGTITATLTVDGDGCMVTTDHTDPSGPPCGVNWSTFVSATCTTVGAIDLVIDSNTTIPYPQTCISAVEDCNVAGSGWVRASMLATQQDASFQSFTAADGDCTITTGPTAGAPNTPVNSTGTIAINGVMHTYELIHP